MLAIQTSGWVITNTGKSGNDPKGWPGGRLRVHRLRHALRPRHRSIALTSTAALMINIITAEMVQVRNNNSIWLPFTAGEGFAVDVGMPNRHHYMAGKIDGRLANGQVAQQRLSLQHALKQSTLVRGACGIKRSARAR